MNVSRSGFLARTACTTIHTDFAADTKSVKINEIKNLISGTKCRHCGNRMSSTPVSLLHMYLKCSHKKNGKFNEFLFCLLFETDENALNKQR